ncbi:MAG: transposase [Candidatus Thermoplasmatota archaeon]|nr:transposase [Candidatus Thermoplasmatota archaeon]
MDIMNYGVREKYEQLKKFGNRLSDLYINDTEKGGRPNFDPVFMIKVMFLKSLYGLVNVAMETKLYSNIRFINFLDYPESMPDARTIWLFRERIVDNHKDMEIWKQLRENSITVRKGAIPDATFIESDPGHGKARKGDGTIPVDPEFPD